MLCNSGAVSCSLLSSIAGIARRRAEASLYRPVRTPGTTSPGVALASAGIRSLSTAKRRRALLYNLGRCGGEFNRLAQGCRDTIKLDI